MTNEDRRRLQRFRRKYTERYAALLDIEAAPF